MKKVKFFWFCCYMTSSSFLFSFSASSTSLDLYMVTSPRCCVFLILFIYSLKNVKTLKCYLNCKLTSWPAKVLWMLVEDMGQRVRDKGLFIWHNS